MTEPTPQEQETLDVYERFHADVYNNGNLEAIDDLVAEDFQHHAPIPTPDGRSGFKSFMSTFRTAFPDATSTTEDVVVSGDKIAVRYVMQGTHRGEFADVPATGRSVEVQGISIYRIADGQVAEEWAQPDMMGMMQQLGAFPEPSVEGGDEPFLLAGEEGTPIWSFGVLMNLKATGEDTGGAFALVDHLADPGVESPYHVHHNEEELFYVLDGEVECYFGEDGDERVRAGPGDTVYLAREVPHGFRVVSDEPCRMLVLVAPAGLEGLWIEAGEPAPELTTPPPPEESPDLDALAPLAEQYGIEFLGPIPN